MGASVGNAIGFEKGNIGHTGSKAVGVIGDSTFLHGGIQGLIDMVYTNSSATLLIADNSTTGMTGQQENPSTGKTVSGEPAPSVDLVKLVKSIGVKFVREVDPYDMKRFRKTLRDAIKHPGPSVVIGKHACLMIREERRKHADRVPIHFEAEDCNLCKQCYELGCPATDWSDETGPIIDELQCVGCEMCAELCKPGALYGPVAAE